MKSKEKAVIIAENLDRLYPEKIEFLEYENSYQLLITVILTAQTTDRQVMKVTPELFRKYPTPSLLGKAGQQDIEKIIKSTGFFKVKAANIIKTASILAEKYNSIVPNNIEELVKFPGVGRKTANVVVGTLFAKPAVIVDTHFKRVVKRLGITKNDSPDKVEEDIKKIIPEGMQYRFSMTANLHGRIVCHARKPECGNCKITESCNFFKGLSL